MLNILYLLTRHNWLARGLYSQAGLYCGNTVTGTRQWLGRSVDKPVMGYEGSDATAGYCELNDTPHFKLLKPSSQELISLYGDTPVWQANGIVSLGSLRELLRVPSEPVLEPAYTNPFNPVTTINFDCRQNLK